MRRQRTRPGTTPTYRFVCYKRNVILMPPVPLSASARPHELPRALPLPSRTSNQLLARCACNTPNLLRPAKPRSTASHDRVQRIRSPRASPSILHRAARLLVWPRSARVRWDVMCLCSLLVPSGCRAVRAVIPADRLRPCNATHVPLRRPFACPAFQIALILGHPQPRAPATLHCTPLWRRAQAVVLPSIQGLQRDVAQCFSVRLLHAAPRLHMLLERTELKARRSPRGHQHHCLAGRAQPTLCAKDTSRGAGTTVRSVPLLG